MYDVETIDENVNGFGGQAVHATKKVKQKNFVRQKMGKLRKEFSNWSNIAQMELIYLFPLRLRWKRRAFSFIAMLKTTLS